MDGKRNKLAEAEIDQLMRGVFDQLANEPVPDRFHALIEKLRAGDMPDDTSDTSGKDD